MSFLFDTWPGLSDCLAIGCIVIIFVTVVTPNFERSLFHLPTRTLLVTDFELSKAIVAAGPFVRLSFLSSQDA
jgi:hypothetical protein